MQGKIGLTYENVILKHNMSCLASRTEADISVTVNNKTFESPIILTNMPSVQNETVLSIFNKRKWAYVYHRMGGCEDIYNFTKKINDENWYLRSISVGVDRKDYQLLKSIKHDGLNLDWITIDVALIYNAHFEDRIKEIRDLFPEVYLIAGNGTTRETAEWLESLGVQAFKHGIGSSTLCRTRQYTGFGTSILSNLHECAESCNLDIISDGGLRVLNEVTGEIAFGDIFKALNFGATWVMASTLFRWIKELENPHGIIEQYGNSTVRAKGYNRNIEGACKIYTSNGQSLEDRMDQIVQNLQSSVSYAGIESIKDAYMSCNWEIV